MLAPMLRKVLRFNILYHVRLTSIRIGQAIYRKSVSIPQPSDSVVAFKQFTIFNPKMAVP